MIEYSKYHEEEVLPPLMKEPVLSDYYKPQDPTSRNMEIGVAVLGTMAAVSIGYFVIWKKYVKKR